MAMNISNIKMWECVIDGEKDMLKQFRKERKEIRSNIKVELGKLRSEIENQPMWECEIKACDVCVDALDKIRVQRERLVKNVMAADSRLKNKAMWDCQIMEYQGMPRPIYP